MPPIKKSTNLASSSITPTSEIKIASPASKVQKHPEKLSKNHIDPFYSSSKKNHLLVNLQLKEIINQKSLKTDPSLSVAPKPNLSKTKVVNTSVLPKITSTVNPLIKSTDIEDLIFS